jgi:NADH-quinone oxidoreductase subunit B
VALTAPPAAAPATLVLERGLRVTLTVLNVGLACCAVEAMVAALGDRHGAVPYAGPERDVQVLVVSGTVTDKLGPLVQRLHAELPGPVRVMAFGACASSGGPYWDSYCVVSGVDQLVPVDVYVPGCPPRPEALLDGLRALLDASSTPLPSGPLVRPATGVVGPQDLRARPVTP